MGNNLGLRLPLKHTGKSLDLCSSSQLKTCSSERHIANDRLSSLPDEILFSILSFLTFKEVAMTSLLSHRWLNLWLDTPVLTFHTPDPEAASLSSKVCLYYVTWVNRVLQRHRGQYLAKFEIVCDLDIHYQEDIDNWLVFAFSRKVQRLELNLSHHASSPTRSEINYVFPDQLLGFSSGKANSNGGQFDLECLKHLSLKNVDVTCEAINMFLLHCPFLERLEVGDTDKLVNLEISGPNLALKYLKIKRCFNLEVLSISNFNLVSLDIVSVGDLTLTDLPMLVELSISMKFGLSLSHCFSQATSCHSELEALALREITRFKDIIELSKLDRLTKLTKLKRLTIEVGTFGDESLTVLFSIINPCPCLEEFTLELLSFGLDKRAIIEVERNRSSPKNHSLKVFEFSGYNGCVSNDELISHIVENAVRLEKIIIDPYDGPWCVSNPTGMEARSLALKQLKDLRKSGSIPPHVEVVIREPYTLNACASLWHWNDERRCDLE